MMRTRRLKTKEERYKEEREEAEGLSSFTRTKILLSSESHIINFFRFLCTQILLSFSSLFMQDLRDDAFLNNRL